MTAPTPVKAVNTKTAQEIATLQAEHAQLLQQKRKFEIQRKEGAEGEAATEARLRVVEAALDGIRMGQQFQRDFEAAQKGE